MGKLSACLKNYDTLLFKTQFACRDMQDYVAIVMIWYATQAGNERKPSFEKEMADALEKLEAQLDKVQ